MTDADDAGLVQRMRIVTTLPSRLRSQDDIDEKLLVAADRIEFQRQEIEELREALIDARQDLARRREVAKAHEARTRKIVAAGAEALTRAEKAEAALAKAVKHINALMEAGPEGYAAAYKAASAFIEKHGGRDG